MKIPFLSLLLTLCLLLGGCLPEARVWWSPDGREAAVLSEGALYLVQPDGVLGDPVSGGPADKAVTPRAISWLPDGSGFVLCRERRVASWEEVVRLVPAAESSKIALLALTIPALLEGADKLAGPEQDAETLLSAAVSGNSDDYLMALLCAYQAHREEVGKLLRQLPKGAELLSSLEGENSQFTVYEVALVRPADKGPAAPPLARSLYALSQPGVSPGQKAVAWLRTQGKAVSLEAASLEGSEQRTVGTTVKPTFDWSPDGRTLVFACPLGGEEDSLAKIQRVPVIGESGDWIRQNNTSSGVTELGLAILLDPPRLQALPDGRLLFSSQDVSLPTTGAEIAPKLFVLSADGKNLATVPTAPGSLPANLSFFTASPDGRFAAVVESGSDAVAVVDLGSGAVEVISPAHPDWQCRTMPAWKSPTELTFAALDKSGNPAWMLWSKAEGVQTISQKWPARATADWLKKEEPQKAATPGK